MRPALRYLSWADIQRNKHARVTSNIGPKLVPSRHFSYHVGPIPTEPVCITAGTPKAERPPFYSGIIRPKTPEGVSNTPTNHVLQFTSLDAAKESLNTVIHVIGASSQLGIEDFKRLLPEGQHIPGWRSEGGLTKIIPMRHHKTLERQDQWLLTFSTPYHASLYHSRLHWYHRNARINSRVPLTSASATAQPRIPPMPGMIDSASGEDLFRRVQEYTILPPTQKAMAKLHVPPFPATILSNLWWHHQWTKPDPKGRVAFPVMISLAPAQRWFSGQMVWELIRKDGEQRGLMWDVYDSEAGVQRMFHATYETQEQPSADGSGTADTPMGDHDVIDVLGGGGMGLNDEGEGYNVSPMDRNKWMVRFRDEDEAKRFIRRWDGRDWDVAPDGNSGSPGWYVSPKLRLDRLW